MNNSFNIQNNKKINNINKKESSLETLPLVPIRNIVFFPYMILPLFISRNSSITAVKVAMERNQTILLITQRNKFIEFPTAEDLYEIGSVASIIRHFCLPDGRLKILVKGLIRARISNWIRYNPYYEITIEPLISIYNSNFSTIIKKLTHNIREISEKILSLRGLLSGKIITSLNSIKDPDSFADIIANNLYSKIIDLQKILEELDVIERLKKIDTYLSKEKKLFFDKDITQFNNEVISNIQKEYFFHKQIKTNNYKLCNVKKIEQDLIILRKTLENKNIPIESHNEIMKQVYRLEQMQFEAAEVSIIRRYLDWIAALPWDEFTRERINIKYATRVLNKKHYNLKKVKDRVLEYLAVRKLNPEIKVPILCFLGPPGVGKTSLGQSIAQALGRKFTRISLGGIRDEAEIRGHRRTYIGAMPGCIIQGLKNVGVNNPVFMLDEVDKICNDSRGDPTAALLEVLDSEQNYAFNDHYLNIPFNLSKVMFITTANMEESIPEVLLDRMEVIEINGYTDEDKVTITTNHLLPRQLKEHGLNLSQVFISKNAIKEIIRGWTREAGLRNLEREVANICRKLARKVVEGINGPFHIKVDGIRRLLGIPKFFPDEERGEGEIGVATGLAWTTFGGEVLRVEVSLVEGKGNLTLTGSLGEIMKESAQAALSYTRSRAQELGLKSGFYENFDLHLHVPSGAIPKDGPSAGVTICTAIVSALTGVAVKKEIAMTGEITLTGKVLSIGGFKEKALAALRIGIKNVIAPAKNKKEVLEIPSKIRRQLNLYFVNHMDEILAIALIKSPHCKTNFSSNNKNLIKSHPISQSNSIKSSKINKKKRVHK